MQEKYTDTLRRDTSAQRKSCRFDYHTARIFQTFLYDPFRTETLKEAQFVATVMTTEIKHLDLYTFLFLRTAFPWNTFVRLNKIFERKYNILRQLSINVYTVNNGTILKRRTMVAIK